MDVREVADLSRRYSSRESTARDGGAAGERFAVDVAQCRGPRELGRYSDSLRFGGFGDQIPVGGEIFCTSPDRPWGPPSLLYNGHRVVKRPGRGVYHPLPSSAEVKERVELYLHSPCTFMVCFRVNLPSYMTQCRLVINYQCVRRHVSYEGCVTKHGNSTAFPSLIYVFVVPGLRIWASMA